MTDWLPPMPVDDNGKAVRTPATEDAHARFKTGPARWRLTTGIGPSRRDLWAALQVFRARSARDQADMRAAHVRAKTAEKELRRIQQAAAESLALAFEPTVTDCTKTRLHTVEEAEAFAAKAAAGLGAEPDSFLVYRCKVCPRHPATGQRFLHIANRDPQMRGAAGEEAKRERGLRAAHARRRAGNVSIAQNMSADDVARLRSRFSCDSSTEGTP